MFNPPLWPMSCKTRHPKAHHHFGPTRYTGWICQNWTPSCEEGKQRSQGQHPPRCALFEALPSGKWFRTIKTRTNRLKNNFYSWAVACLKALLQSKQELQKICIKSPFYIAARFLCCFCLFIWCYSLCYCL